MHFLFFWFFYFLAITNIAAMNIHIQISCICARISVIYFQVKFLGCRPVDKTDFKIIKVKVKKKSPIKYSHLLAS